MTKARSRVRAGILLESHRFLTRDSELRTLHLPSTAVIPLTQFDGAQAEWIVRENEWVAEEQQLARPLGPTDLPLHSPIPGRVVGFRDVQLPGGRVSSAALVRLEGAFSRTGRPAPSSSWVDESEVELRSRLEKAGVFAESGPLDPRVHLPSIEPGIDALVVNVLQPEPYLTLSSQLQSQFFDELIEGLRILQKLLRPLQTHWVTDEDLGDGDRSALERGTERTEVTVLPFRYPQAQRGLLLSALGLNSVRPGRTLVLDASSLLSIREAVVSQRPQVERVVVVSGRGVARPGLYRVRIGTTFHALLKEAGGLGPQVKILHGGPFRGSVVDDLSAPVLKSTQSLTVLTPGEVNQRTERPCIRCGQCAADCPVGLEPLNLFRLLRQEKSEQAVAEGLSFCLECGICSFVCPSRVPLSETFRHAKEASSES